MKLGPRINIGLLEFNNIGPHSVFRGPILILGPNFKFQSYVSTILTNMYIIVTKCLQSRPQISINLMKTAVLNSFFKFYVMSRTGIDLYGIDHVKVDFIPVLKMCVLPMLGRFVWTTIFDNVLTALISLIPSVNLTPVQFFVKLCKICRKSTNFEKYW